MSCDMDIRRRPATGTASQSMSRIVTVSEIGKSRWVWSTGMKGSATYSEEVWELRNQTNSWIEDCLQHSNPSETHSLQHHRPYSKQSLSKVQPWPFQTAENRISTSMCLDLLALWTSMLGTYKAVLLDQIRVFTATEGGFFGHQSSWFGCHRSTNWSR